MSNVKITQLPAAGQLTGEEVLPIVQDGVTVKASAQDIANLGGGGMGSLKVVSNGSLGGPFTISSSISTILLPSDQGDITLNFDNLPDIQMNAGAGYGSSTPTATEVSFPEVTVVHNLKYSGSNTLESFSAPELVRTSTTGSIEFTNSTALSTLSFPKLQYARYTAYSCPALTIGPGAFPVLETLETSANANSGLLDVDNITFPALTSLSFQSLGDFKIRKISSPLITSFKADFTSLSWGTTSNLQEVNLPNVVTMESSYTTLSSNNTPYLTTFIIGTPGITKRYGPSMSSVYYNFTGVPLNQASVDNMLQVFASLDGTNGTTISNNGTLYLSGLPAAPSSLGLDAISVLLSRGWVLSYNNNGTTTTTSSSSTSTTTSTTTI